MRKMQDRTLNARTVVCGPQRPAHLPLAGKCGEIALERRGVGPLPAKLELGTEEKSARGLIAEVRHFAGVGGVGV
jgi:hypothetical protein